MLLDEVHLLHQLGNVVTQLRGALDSKDAAHDLHPKGGNGVELLKGGRLEATCEDLTGEAVQAKVVVLLGLLLDAHHLALDGLGEVGVNGVFAWFQVPSCLETALRVDEVAVGESEDLFILATLGRNNDTVGADDMRNRALGMGTNLIKRVVLAGVGDNGAGVEARSRRGRWRR